MFLRLSLAITILAMLATSTAASGTDDITFLTEQYPPYNFETDGKVKGISTDIMMAIMKRLGIRRPIRVLPWANAYHRIQTVPNTCLFSMTYTPDRAPLFKWVGPVVNSDVSLVALKKNHVRINRLSDVNNFKVGVIRSDIGEQLLLKGGVKPENIDAVSQTMQNIKKLLSARVDLIAYGEAPLKWEIKRSGHHPEDFETVYRLSKGELFFAFHKDTSDDVIQKFRRALDELKADGTCHKIIDRYLE